MDKVKLCHFHITSNEVMWPKKIFKLHHAAVKKCRFGNFSDRAGMVSATLKKPSQEFQKFLFALCADEFLAILEGKIRVTPFIKVQSDKIAMCAQSISCNPPKISTASINFLID